MSFPVFRLISRKPEVADGVTYYSNSYLNQDTGLIETHIKLVDNKGETGATLGQRRLRMASNNAPMYPLRTAIYFLGDFIKLAKSGYWFIDNNGDVFTYKKSMNAKLTFKRIKQIIPSTSTGSIVEVEGCPDRFKTLFVAQPTDKYAGILEYKGISIFYGLYDKQYKDTRRMI